MCGIFGYLGKKNAIKEVYNGLKLLQYRGYDSCGIAYYNDNGFKINKAVGALDNLKLDNANSHIAFGHTRWATNGEVNLKNTHPHFSYNGEITLVHNGIITNADEIKNSLIKKGVKFYSQTDTEVIANFIAQYNDKVEALKAIYSHLKGSFALIIGLNNGDIYLLKQFCPLNLVKNENGIFISSDVASLSSGSLYRLNDGDIIKISKNNISAILGEINFKNYSNNIKLLDKGNFKHYMLKEIYETPTSIKNTYNYIKKHNIRKFFKGIKNLTLIGCGTAYNSCLMGEGFLKDNFSVTTTLASNYEVNKNIKNNHLHIIVSQSGETADCIKVCENIKQYNGKIMVITNVENSTLTRFADIVLYTKANTELAVASTKTYCAQVFTFAYISKILKDKNYTLNIGKLTDQLARYIKEIDVSKYSELLSNTDKLLLIAKGNDYNLLLEASLKIREIDYIYTIPIYAGELKHGTLSLIDENAVVLALNRNNNLKTAISEIYSRKGRVLDFGSYSSSIKLEEEYRAIFDIIPFQLLSYQVALKKGINPDMPKNLSKSVTVE